MKITITSTLTEEQATLLAKEKGWQETIIISIPSEETKTIYDTLLETEITVPVSFSDEVVPNTKTSFDFLKNVYENMIKDDAKRLFIAYDDRLNIDKKLTREQLLKDMVDASFV